MTDHLSHGILSALVDGELTADQLASANKHLAGCPSCTSNALYQSLLKSATARAGHRYTPPPQLRERLVLLAAQTNSQLQSRGIRRAYISQLRLFGRFGSLGWVAVAALLLVSLSLVFVQRAAQRAEKVSAQHSALVTEVFDQHVATLADNQPLQVISTDRHTVKPWFQGRIPFSFNLPQGLPSDTTLDGANLTYLGDQPAAQLVYSIGKHRVSVFLRQRSGRAEANELPAERSGFHVLGFSISDLEVVAVSDVDPARLAELVSAIRHAQTGDQQQFLP
jgi:anti-sigma factor RsiW